ncbi:hypothetical protein QYF61_005376 [Mycteria americana]|uniref:RNase H type-1 domain-containing protein n=1 Tax=Mycteria americana TaxID=33587 RepID=A0AAN7N7S1_MYCAM|nr:hypothetical protein QYF61_005376 [Mycteria americana]
MSVITGSPNKELKIPEVLKSVPTKLWSKSSRDVGLPVSAQPVDIKTKGGHPPPAVKQYPSPQEAEKSIQKQIDGYLAQGILKACVSPCNTPILPVRKDRFDEDGDPAYRFVQDLRVVNQHVVTSHPVVPDPSTILLQIPHWARYFTVIDLRAAFFSIPVDEDSQLLPKIKLPGKSALVQYVDDLLTASKDEDACIKDTIHLCTALAEKGHRASPSTLQLCQKEVKSLGFILREGQWVIDPEGIEAIIKLPRAVTKKQLRGFLGAVGFCRPWIPESGELTRSLTEATRTEEIEPSAWGPEREQAFKMIKGALASAPALGLPECTNPFNLHVHGQKGIASGVVTQKLGPHRRPDAYDSSQLDPGATGAPACNKSVAAAAAVLEKSRPLVLGHPVTVYVPHEVEILLKQYATQALLLQRAHRYELILLMADNVTLRRCNTLNPAMLFPSPDEGEEHDQCKRVMLTSSKPGTDLTDVPLQNPDLALFVDGSSYYLHGQRRTGYEVVSQGQVMEAEPLPARLSAQGAELVALTRTAHLGKGKRVNTYTGSRYAFGERRAAGMSWKEQGFFTSSGKRVSNREEIRSLLESVQLPREIAVIHCPAHSKDTTEISDGNALADAAARAAAQQPLKERMVAISMDNQNEWPHLRDPKAMYEKDSTAQEKKPWESGKQNKMTTGYGQLEENQFCQRSI